MFNICLILLSNSMVPYNLIDSQGACSACRSTTTRRKGRSVREEGFKREVVRRWRDGSHSRKLSRMRFILKLRRTLNALSDDLQTSYKKFMVFAVRQTENRWELVSPKFMELKGWARSIRLSVRRRRQNATEKISFISYILTLKQTSYWSSTVSSNILSTIPIVSFLMCYQLH